METKKSQKVLFSLLILVGSIALAGAVSAATLDVGPSGHTYTTINAALAAAGPGDTILVFDDSGASYTYNENVDINGVSDLNLTASGNVTVTASNANNPTFTVREDNTIINGFTIMGATGSSGGTEAAGIRIRANANDVFILNNIITGNCVGIYITSGTSIIQGNLIYDNNDDGVRVEGGNNQFIGNTLSDNEDGFDLEGGTNNVTGNNITENDENGILVQGGRNTIISNNIIENDYNGIRVEGCSPTTEIHFNRIVDNDQYDLRVEDNNCVNAENNWWGTNSPTYVRSYYAPSYCTNIWEHRFSCFSPRVDYDPWLVLNVDAEPCVICNTQTSVVTATLTENSDCQDTSAWGHVPDGTPVHFTLLAPILGTLNPTDIVTTNGEAQTTFTANTAGTQKVQATVDHQDVCTSILINPAASIVMTKTSNTPVNVGETGIFTVTVTNNGPDDAQGVRLTDVLVDGFTPGTPTQGTYYPLTGLWDIGTLVNGTTATLNFTKVMTQADSGNTFCNNATDFQTCTCMLDPVADQQACLYVKKCSLYVNVNPTLINTFVGNTVTITYKVGNNGPDTADGVVMTYVIPDGLEFVSATSPDWTQPTYDPATRTVTWNLGDVPMGDPTLYLNVKVLRAGTFNIAPTIISATCSGQPVIVATTTVNAQEQVQAQAATATVGMQTTGSPIVALILAGIMVFAGMLLPKRK